MKILIVNKFLYPNGGSETYIFGLGKQLVRMGHEVQYFGMEHEGRIVGNAAESYTSDMDFHTGKFKKILYPFKIIYSFEARRKIRAVLKDFKPDVVHLNNINFQLTPAIIYEIKKYEKEKNRLISNKGGRDEAKSKADKGRVKIVYTAHDYQWVCPNHMMMIPDSGEICFKCRNGKFRECTKNRCIHGSLVKSLLGSAEAFYYKFRKTYGMVDVIICPSEFIKKQLDTDRLLAGKTVVMHNFLNTDDTDYADETDAAKREENSKTNVGQKDKETAGSLPERYALYFGRFSMEKGVETLIEVCRKTSHINYVFAGAGPLEKELEGLPNVKNIGFVSGFELKRLISQAQFSIYPSQWYENCPFSVMESQLYKTPVIASNIGGIPELVEEGTTGELFEAGNEKELESKIRKLWNDEDLCHRYSENCKNIKFNTIEQYCGKIVDEVYSG